MTPVTPVTTRPMRPEDLDAVHAIDQVAYAVPWSRDLLAADIDRPDRCHLVAIDADDAALPIVGHASMFHVAGEATLSTVAVAQIAQGQGVATRLLLDLFADALDRETTDVTLEVRASSRTAQRLYHRFGFVPEGLRANYYKPDGEDAVLMWARNIGDSPAVARRAAIAESLASTGQLSVPTTCTSGGLPA